MMPKRKNKTSSKSQSCFEMWKRQRASLNLSEEEKKDVETLFGKHFKYTPLTSNVCENRRTHFDEAVLQDSSITPGWRVEDYFVLAEDNSLSDWQDESLMSLKKEMNYLKCQLSDKDIEQWHTHTTACNLAGKILPFVKNLHVELCTQAWVKFYEILSAFKIVPDSDFYSLHLCEAPGAFIAALNHHLQLQAFPHSWGWKATTLNPYYEANSTDEMVADDRLFRYAYSHCYFGPDGSGDIRADGHIAGIHDLTRDLEKTGNVQVLLVTADGSRDCQENPAEQESHLAQLHYCEMIAACLVLAKGGNFVLKVFTMFETSTISLVFLLHVMFEEVHAFKPATSKSGNSETYLVCLNYRKNVTDETLWRMLSTVLGSNITCFVRPSDLPVKFMEEHKSCCRKFSQWQASTIRRNMQLFELDSQEALKLVESRQEAAMDLFLERTNLVHNRHIKRLVRSQWETSPFTTFMAMADSRHGEKHHQGGGFQGYQKYLKGTFHLRQSLNSMSISERISFMSLKDESQQDIILIIRCPIEGHEVKDLQCMERARRFDEIRSSHLCSYELLNDLNTLLQHSEVFESQAKSEHNHATALTEMLVKILTNPREEVHKQDERDSETQNLKSERTKPISFQPHHISSSPGKKMFNCETESGVTGMSHCVARSPRSLYRPKGVLHWIKKEDDTKDSDFEKNLKDSLSSHCFPLSVLSPSVKANEVKDLERGSYLFMDLSSVSYKPDSLCAQSKTINYTELFTKRTCINKILWALQNLPHGSNLILLVTTLLTRFSAGFVYLLARCFHSTAIRSSPNLKLHQFLVLEDFQGASEAVTQLLDNVRNVLEKEDENVSSSENTLVEFVKFHRIINDRKFVQFLKSHNNFLLASVINIILKHCKSR